jgi:hypothetical protein
VNGTLTRAVQRAARRGNLSADILEALTTVDPGWTCDPAERRWWATHTAYRQWLDTHHGEAPTTFDSAAAGLPRWLSSQQDQNLTLQQRKALRRIPGWTRTAGNVEWDDARAAIASLLGAGVRTTDGDISPELLVDVTRSSPRKLPDSAAKRRQLLTVLTFSVQTGRLPEHLEPGNRWQSTIAEDVRTLLPSSVFAKPRLTVLRHINVRTTMLRAKTEGLPYDEAALSAEEAWHRRHTSLARRSLLTKADAEAVLTA